MRANSSYYSTSHYLYKRMRLYTLCYIESIAIKSLILNKRKKPGKLKHNFLHLCIKLANHQAVSLEKEEEEEDLLPLDINKSLVIALYEALATKDIKAVHRLLAPDLEWWFHGPPPHQHHLMRLLTARSSSSSFTFHPLSPVFSFGSTVLVEGFNKDWNVSWVHAWTVTDGLFTQVKEYFNTSVTVTHFGNGMSMSTPAAFMSQSSPNCQSVWQSMLSDNESVPGLVLAL